MKKSILLVVALCCLALPGAGKIVRDRAMARLNRRTLAMMMDGRPSPHMLITPKRADTETDRRRAAAILARLRNVLVPYRDYRRAIADGFKPVATGLSLEEYHFANSWNGLKAAFRFDPGAPTALLYRKSGSGYELIGAMYTAPRNAGIEQLDERVPLSVGRWHEHIDVCMPASPDPGVDWRRFGPRGSIATAADCRRAGGTFHPQLFGWMLHVYPYQKTPAKVWEMPMAMTMRNWVRLSPQRMATCASGSAGWGSTAES